MRSRLEGTAGQAKRWALGLIGAALLASAADAASMPLKFNDDGALDILIQAGSPGTEKFANWLPAPASGPVSLTVRNYWPKEAALDGSYKMPPVRESP